MQLERKTVRLVSVKALDKAEGIAELVVAVFGNVDSANERIRSGAFQKTLAKKLPKGVWMHDWSQPVAKTIEARELTPGDPLLPADATELGGLYIKGQFNLETQRGREAFSDVAGGYVDEYSIGYKVLVATGPDKETGVRDLIELELYEWSPVLVAANRQTGMISVKDAKGKEAVDYLGESAELDASMAAVARLNDLLMWRVVYSTLVDGFMPVTQKLERIRGGFDEFRDMSLKVIEALIVDGREEIATKMIAALWPSPEGLDGTTEVKSGSRAGLVFVDHSVRVHAAVKGWIERLIDIGELRFKEGRTFSQGNLDSLTSMIDDIEAACGKGRKVLKGKGGDPDDAKTAPREAEEQFIKLQGILARYNGVTI